MAGRGLAILVNANAKRGGRRVAVQMGRALADASVRLTRTEDEIDAWLRLLKKTSAPQCILAAGGDGTAIALVNAMARVGMDRAEQPMGLLPLGTGNGWAHALGAPKLDRCLRLLASAKGPLPTRKLGLFECEGTLAHFAGQGWDAMILDDYKRQLEASKGPGRELSKSVWGYLSATLLRTAPRVAIQGNPHLIIENLGDDVFTITADGKLLKVHGAARGSVLYDGPSGCASVGTCNEFGYGFKAFPFADRLTSMFNVRVYDRRAVPAVLSIPRLWRGMHPLRGMHDWFATAVRMTFSRPIPLQIGGDARGSRQTVEYRIAPPEVVMLDWRRMLDGSPTDPSLRSGVRLDANVH